MRTKTPPTNTHLRNTLKEVVKLRKKNLKEKSKQTRKQNNKTQECLLRDIRQVLRIGIPKIIDGRIVVKRKNGYVKIYNNWPEYYKKETKYKLNNKPYVKYKRRTRDKVFNRKRNRV